MTVIEIKPSRLLFVLVTGMHVVAAFSLGFSVEPMVWLGGLALVAGSCVRFWTQWRKAGTRLGLASEGDLLIDPDGAAERRLRLGSETTVTPFAVWLVWPRQGVGRGGTLLVMRDQATSEAWRRLQIWARLRAGPVAGRGVENA